LFAFIGIYTKITVFVNSLQVFLAFSAGFINFCNKLTYLKFKNSGAMQKDDKNNT